jgi:hypothetical protein
MPGKDLVSKQGAPPARSPRRDGSRGFKVGEEHPLHKGWFYTGKFDRKGEPLWYRPPSAFFRFIRPDWTEQLRGRKWHVRHRIHDWVGRIVLYGFLALFSLMLLAVLSGKVSVESRASPMAATGSVSAPPVGPSDR